MGGTFGRRTGQGEFEFVQGKGIVRGVPEVPIAFAIGGFVGVEEIGGGDEAADIDAGHRRDKMRRGLAAGQDAFLLSNRFQGVETAAQVGVLLFKFVEFRVIRMRQRSAAEEHPAHANSSCERSEPF